MRRYLLIVASACAIIALAAGAVSAQTTPATHTLTVKAGGDGSGVIHGSSIDCWPQDGKPVGPCTVTEVAGNVVTLTATASKGSVFTGWSGDGCSGTGACTVTLSSDVTVTASFALSTASARGGTLSVSPSAHTTSVAMTCHGPGSCFGSVQLSAKHYGQVIKFATSSYNIGSGKTTKVKLTLSRRAVSMIAHSHNRLRATLTVLPVDGSAKTTNVRLRL